VLCPARRSGKHDIEAEKAKPPVLTVRQPDRADYAISVVNK
jgi:hypothetical protein